MHVVIDTSAIIAVLLAEEERAKILELTTQKELIAPPSVPWEMANAFSAMLKRQRIDVETAQKAWKLFEEIPIEYKHVDFPEVLKLCHQYNIYAYDAYLLYTTLHYHTPLLTLDRGLKHVANEAKATLLEV